MQNALSFPLARANQKKERGYSFAFWGSKLSTRLEQLEKCIHFIFRFIVRNCSGIVISERACRHMTQSFDPKRVHEIFLQISESTKLFFKILLFIS